MKAILRILGWGGFASIFLCVSGCGDGAGAGSAPKRTAGYVRAISFVDGVGEVKFGGWRLGEARTAHPHVFHRVKARPDKLEVDFGAEKKGTFPVDVADGLAHTVFLTSNGHDLKGTLIVGEPRKADDDVSLAAFANVLDNTVEFEIRPSDPAAEARKLRVEPGKLSPALNLESGSYTITARAAGLGSATGQLNIKYGDAFTIAVGPRNGKLQVVVIHNNPPMVAAPMGASPVG